MSVTLHVDGDRWRSHLAKVTEATEGIVPVAKGNGYGFGLAQLARRAQRLAEDFTGVDTLAVGTYDELAEAAGGFAGSLLVLSPWRPFGAALQYTEGAVDDSGAAGAAESRRHRVIHTIGRLGDLADLLRREPTARLVLERRTTMLRHGFTGPELKEAAAVLAEHGGRATLEGVAFHFPLAQGTHLPELQRLMNDVVAADLPTRTVWVSHLDDAELTWLRSAYGDYTVRPRIGTGLWLGDRGALHVTATVLDAHPVQRGESYGYRRRSAPRDGTVLVVSGGTAHGIGLEAPTGAQTLRSRAASIARGGLDAAGLVRSPYTIGGKLRLFAEPPHMQASMLFLPDGADVPAIGSEVDLRVRYTATSFDRVVLG